MKMHDAANVGVFGSFLLYADQLQSISPFLEDRQLLPAVNPTSMARRARMVVPGLPHHLTQRGNRKADVFCDPEDRHLYLEFVLEYFSRYSVKLWAYALMSNHVHLIAVPERSIGLSCALRDLHAAYAAAFNRRYGVTGHLWQARFYSCVMDDEHLASAVRYVERNPVRAGLVDKAEDYPWSSAWAHVRREGDRYLDGGLALVDAVEDWSRWLAIEENEQRIQAIRDATATGRPCGSDAFAERLESEYGRALRPQRRGRKPKQLISADSDLASNGWR